MKQITEDIERIKPTLYLTENDLPAIKDWKVGKKYDLILTVKMISSTLDMEREKSHKGKKHLMVSGRFEIIVIDTPEETNLLEDQDYTTQKLKMLEEKANK